MKQYEQMTLAEIENQYGFNYSHLYKQLAQDGMLDVGEYGPDWYSTVFPRLKENPTLLLFSYDFELLNIKVIPEEINELSNQNGYRQINPKFRFIPFAQTGAGDHYCFFLNEQNGDDIPIVLLWHDSNEATYLARNLQDFIFKMLVTDMSDQDTYNKITDEEFKSNIHSVLKTHAKYLTEQQSKILHNLLSGVITDYEIKLPNGRKEKHRGFLTATALEKIVTDTIPYDKMCSSFDYTLPQPIKAITEENMRRVGIITIKIQPIPPKGDRIYNNLKELNWRQQKADSVDHLMYYRKQSVIFGIPSMQTIEETYKQKLLAIKSVGNFRIDIQFTEDGTGVIYNL